jgi:hypothetical protein
VRSSASYNFFWATGTPNLQHHQLQMCGEPATLDEASTPSREILTAGLSTFERLVCAYRCCCRDEVDQLHAIPTVYTSEDKRAVCQLVQPTAAEKPSAKLQVSRPTEAATRLPRPSPQTSVTTSVLKFPHAASRLAARLPSWIDTSQSHIEGHHRMRSQPPCHGYHVLPFWDSRVPTVSFVRFTLARFTQSRVTFRVAPSG